MLEDRFMLEDRSQRRGTHTAIALERVGVAGPQEESLTRLDERGERRAAEDFVAEARRVHVVVAV